MMTAKQLVYSTLADLGAQIVKTQSELKQLEGERRDLIDIVIGIEFTQQRLRKEIKALKDRAEWNQREGIRLHSEPVGESQPAPGEEWKRPE